MIRGWILCLFFFLLHCSTPDTPRKIEVGFYHWKSQLQLSTKEENYLSQINAQSIYLRLFDLDWDASYNGVAPIAVLEKQKDLPSTLRIVPTIFITNRAIKNTPEAAIPDLAQKIEQKIHDQIKDLQLDNVDELQIDCDWTESTQKRYFALLGLLKEQFGGVDIQLSATIRLHQIKYRKRTGVPPVDRGMLMCYNTGQLEDWQTRNSILDWETAKQYVDKLPDYPLQLDLALPFFGWGVLFREDKMIRLINNLSAADLQDSLKFKLLEKNRVEVLKSTYLQGYYLYKGDLIRLEWPDVQLLYQVSRELKPLLKTENLNLVYYHLDATTIKKIPHEELQKINDHFAAPL